MREHIAYTGRFALFCLALLHRAVTPPWEVGELARHTVELVARCALPVAAVVFPAGMVLALQGLVIFDLFGAQRLLSPLVSVALYREIGPVLAGVLVAAQGGSAVAAELGAMRIQEELDATEVMGIDAIRVHVVPRFLAIVLATPLLNLLACVAGVWGGFASAVWIKGEPGGIYWANLWDLTTTADLAGSAFKAFVFGLVIGLVACWNGYHASGGAPGVGKAVNDTVVYAATGFILVNYFLTSALFGVI
jgi:phospholipid/cholesterol/gamma-HCH transport system permease protein